MINVCFYFAINSTLSFILQFHSNAIEPTTRFFSEVYPDSGDELGVKRAICVLVEEAGFSHAGVTEG